MQIYSHGRQLNTNFHLIMKFHCYILKKQKFVSRVCIGVQPLGQHPDKGHLKVNMDRLAPGALWTDEGNFNSPAEGTPHMAICTCLTQVASEKKKKVVWVLWPAQTTCICNGRKLISSSLIIFHYLLFHILPSIHHLQTKFPRG